MFLVPRKQIWTSQPSGPVDILRDAPINSGIRRLIDARQPNIDLAEGASVTSLNGGSVSAPLATTPFGVGCKVDNTVNNSCCITPSWTNVTSEASALMVLNRTTSGSNTGWELGGTGSQDHFPFSNLAYFDVFWGSRWANGVSPPAGKSFADPVVLVFTVKNGEQRCYWNGELWISTSATGGFTLPANLTFYSSSSLSTQILHAAWDRALTTVEAESLGKNPWQLFKKPDSSIFVPLNTSSGVSYTTTLSGGSYTYSGTSATLTLTEGSAAYSLSLSGSSYSLVGTTLTSSFTRNLELEGSVYSSTGSNFSFVFGRNLVAQSGNYLYSGSSISTLLNRTLLLSGGSYTYSGASASLDYTVAPTNLSLSLSTGSYSYSGSNATLNYSAGSTSYSVALGSGNYSYSGSIASLDYVQGSAEYLLSLSAGNYSYLSGNATLTFTQGATDNTLELTGGNYSYSGGALELTYTANLGVYALSMLGGSYLYAGSNAILLKVSSSDFKVILQINSAITFQQNVLSDISTTLNISSPCTTAINLISAIESIESGG